MKKIYQHIGVVCCLLSCMACANDTLKEDSFIPENNGNEQPLPPNEQWGWVGRFPGEVPVVHERLQNQQVKIQTSYNDIPAGLDKRLANWQSTGLYAPPSEKIRVVVPSNVVGMKYRIGVASILLTGEEKAQRYSSVSRSGELLPGENTIYNDFGGHIYFYFDQAPQLGEVTVEVSGAVKSLDYIPGETLYAVWKNAVDDTVNAGMTWGELIGERVILTLPLATLRKVANPDQLLKYYDELIALDVEPLCGVRSGQMNTPLRLYRDIQLPLTEGKASKCYGSYPLAVNGSVTGMESAMLKVYEPGEKEASQICSSILQAYGMDWGGSPILGNAPVRLLDFHMAARKGNWATSDVTMGSTLATLSKTRQFMGLKQDEKVEMLIQLAQEYGWSIFTYISDRTRKDVSGKIVGEKAMNNMLPVYATEYAGENLVPFFEAWKYPLTKDAADVMATYPELGRDFWTNFESSLPVFDLPKEVVASPWKALQLADTVYSRNNWVVEVQTAQYAYNTANTANEKKKGAANLVDGQASYWISQRGKGVNSNDGKVEDYGMKFPHWATFRFDQCSLNYVYLQHPASGSHPFYGSTLDANRRARKFAIDYLDNNGEWQFVQEYYTDRDYDGMQYFYLPETIVCSGIRFRALSPHLYDSEGDHDNADQTKGTGLAEFGVGLLEYKN